MSQGWSKLFSRINWMNRPSKATSLGATNLNKNDYALDKIDDRVITLDAIKADKTEVNGMVSDVDVNESNGVITITYKDGSTKKYDTNLEKIAVNFSYDKDTQKMILTLPDGTKQYVDLSALITQYEFSNSSTIAFSVDSSGKVSASIKNGSITEAMLETGYLANIKVEVAKAEAAATQAQSSEESSDYNAKLSRSYAVGGSGIRDGEDTDNAMYYAEQAQASAESATSSKESASASANTATLKASEASTSATNAKSSETKAKTSETNASNSALSASTSASNASNSATLAKESEDNAKESETNSKTSETNAASSASSASTSASNASKSAASASTSASTATTKANAAATSAANAKTSETNAKASETNASSYASSASTNASNASKSATSAASSASTATTKASEASASASSASTSASNASASATSAKNSADKAEEALSKMQGAQVTGVKGAKETSYRKGEVNITAENVGAVAVGGDTAENTVTFTSTDAKNPTEYTDVDVLASGEKHKSFLEKIATMFKNIRYLYKMLGSADISAIGDGTVTGGLSTLNSNLKDKYNIASSISAAHNSQPYTIDINGFAIVTITAIPSQTVPLDGSIYLNDAPIANNYFTYYYQSYPIVIPVKKGDIISCTSGFVFSLRIVY